MQFFPVQPVVLAIARVFGAGIGILLVLPNRIGYSTAHEQGVVPDNTRGCGPDITQHMLVDLAGLINKRVLARKGPGH